MLHCPVLDGVYRNCNGVPVFHEAAAPSTDELEAMLLKIITHHAFIDAPGVCLEEPDRTYLAETDTNGALRSLQAASCTYRIALGPRAGQKVLSLRSLPPAISAPPPTLPSKTPTRPRLLLNSAVVDRLGALAIYLRS